MFQRNDNVIGVLDSYHIVGLIGEGGFGVTYRATRASNGAAVALKVMRVDKIDSWKALELFEREAATLATLNHPSIPSYIEFFAQTDAGPVLHDIDQDHVPRSLVLAQDYVYGADLQRQLADGRSFEIDEVEALLRQSLAVLGYLHGLSPPVVHRDVNPRNIILDDAGKLFLVDFGAIQQKVREQTMGGSTAVGSLGYMPIEQSLGKARPASDLYALAVTCLVLMSGLKPDELPLDEQTSKIDLRALDLAPRIDMEPRRLRVAIFLDRALEPIVAQRLSSSAEAIAILDGHHEPVVAANVPATPNGSSATRTLFFLCLGGSVGSAAILYPLNFNEFSETRLIEMAPFWVLPAAFGLIGLSLQQSRRPILYSVLGTIAAALALAFFFVAIFPSL